MENERPIAWFTIEQYETVLGPRLSDEVIAQADAQSHPRAPDDQTSQIYKVRLVRNIFLRCHRNETERYCNQLDLLGPNLWRLITNVTDCFKTHYMAADGNHRAAYLFEPRPGLQKSEWDEFYDKLKTVDHDKPYNWFPYHRDVLEFKPGRYLSLPECCEKMAVSAIQQLENGAEIAVLHFAQKQVRRGAEFDTSYRSLMYPFVLTVEKV